MRGRPCSPWASHFLGSAHAEDGKAAGEHLSCCGDESKPGIAKRFVVDEETLRIVVGMQGRRHVVVEVIGHEMRRTLGRRAREYLGKLRQLLREQLLVGRRKRREVGLRERALV